MKKTKFPKLFVTYVDVFFQRGLKNLNKVVKFCIMPKIHASAAT